MAHPKCQEAGCNATVMSHTGHTLCSRHRPRIKYERPLLTEDERQRRKARKQRQRAAAGLSAQFF